MGTMGVQPPMAVAEPPPKHQEEAIPLPATQARQAREWRGRRSVGSGWLGVLGWFRVISDEGW